MLVIVSVDGRRPKKLPPVMLVIPVVTKSSADSISSVPVPPGRDAVPMRPSGLPVLKVNRSASAGGANAMPSARDATDRACCNVFMEASAFDENGTPKRNFHSATKFCRIIRALAVAPCVSLAAVRKLFRRREPPYAGDIVVG